jgi:hypothetical protein
MTSFINGISPFFANKYLLGSYEALQSLQAALSVQSMEVDSAIKALQAPTAESLSSTISQPIIIHCHPQPLAINGSPAPLALFVEIWLVVPPEPALARGNS